ncbi:MAG: isopentenyl phosphate kinase family protein [Candidatus Lokiarchaeota archaeon]|nr:isopentenyl phosphate kinase family protein [Candidatus Lokiarchaeota archaeon]
MKSNRKIYLLKLGGSLLTDKDKPFSIREDILKSVVQQIIEANEKLILIHGGGSFGHPLAKKYSISKGLNISIPNQILGLTETHQSMIRFNSYLINLFLDQKCPALSFQPSSIFIKDSQEISTKSIGIIETALDLNILPILYGDIILDKQGSFSIISGDQIIFELCDKLEKYSISKVIFALEMDGIFINVQVGNKKDIKLATELHSDELDCLDLADLGMKIDVTGGIEGKINSIKNICKYNIPVQLINGLKDEYVYKSLKNKKLNCTNILIK